jgi:hypothetical protein
MRSPTSSRRPALPEKETVMTDRATAAAVGTLFLVATIAGMIGLSLQESVVGADDYLTAA